LETTKRTAPPIIGCLIGNDTCEVEGLKVTGYSPALLACRELLRQGVSPDRTLELYRNGILAIRIRSIGEGASYTVKDNRFGVPTFHRCQSAALGAARGSRIDDDRGPA
jgi:hypothetical protein